MPVTKTEEKPTHTDASVQEKAATKTRPFLRPAFIGWLLLIGGVIGFAASFVLTIEKMHLLQDPTASLPCNLNPVISCGSVMKTEQAAVFGFANSLIGVGAFAALAALGMALLARAQFKKWLWWLIQAGMLFGLVFVHWLFFQSLYIIGSLCPFCMAVWVVVIVTAWAKPQRLCHVWQSNHQKTPFTTKKEISAGGNSKNKAKGFSGGASGRVRPQALGLSLHGSVAITLEIGSRFFVERSQEEFFCKEAIESNGFLYFNSSAPP